MEVYGCISRYSGILIFTMMGLSFSFMLAVLRLLPFCLRVFSPRKSET